MFLKKGLEFLKKVKKENPERKKKKKKDRCMNIFFKGFRV
jgi:hypothetical protein